jgi:membrane protein implicated in regulation of membrane protease activity
MTFLAVPWHYWVGVVLFLTAIVLLVMIGVLYLVRVKLPEERMKRWQAEQRLQELESGRRPPSLPA